MSVRKHPHFFCISSSPHMCLLQLCFLLKQELPLTSVRSGFPCTPWEVRCEPPVLRLACWGWQRSPTLQRMIQVGNTVVLLSGWSNYSFMKLCEVTALTKGCLSPFPKAELWNPEKRGTWWEATARGGSRCCAVMFRQAAGPAEPGFFWCRDSCRILRSPRVSQEAFSAWGR